MTKMVLQINSLRLQNMMGSTKQTLSWFYNGSILFESLNSNDNTVPENRPRVFTSVTEAVKYFTQNTSESDRAIGQVVTWAYGTYKNWLVHVYTGPDLTDEEYSNPENWQLFGNPTDCPYIGIDEVLSGNEIVYEENMSEEQMQEALMWALCENESGGGTYEGSGSFVKEFDNTEVIDNIINIQHDLKTDDVVVAVYDSENKEVIPDEIIIVDDNNIQLNLEAFIPFADRYKAVILSSGGEAGGGTVEESTFTNPAPSAIAVGGIEEGTTFSRETMQEMFDMMLYPELFPTLTAPSHTFTNSATAVVEVGTTSFVNLNATFSRGTIKPSYETNGFRSGLPEAYVYTGSDLPSRVTTTALTQQHTVSISPTTQRSYQWTCQVEYSGGQQPVSSKGNNYGSALPAGKTTTKSVTVNAVYPYYATTVNITELTKQPLKVASTYYEVAFVVETEINKQTIELYAELGELNGVQVYNTISNAWEWLSGSKAGSTATFLKQSIERNGVSYNRYINTSDKVGARRMRFYIGD